MNNSRHSDPGERSKSEKNYSSANATRNLSLAGIRANWLAPRQRNG